MPLNAIWPAIRANFGYFIIAKYLSLLLTVIFLIIVLGAQRMYIIRVEFPPQRLAPGIITAIKIMQMQDNEDFYSYSFGFTTSQVNLLTIYADQQLVAAPEFITSGTWSYCYGDSTSNFSSETSQAYNGTSVLKAAYSLNMTGLQQRSQDSSVCTAPSARYMFDLNEILKSMNLQVVAFFTEDQDLPSKNLFWCLFYRPCLITALCVSGMLLLASPLEYLYDWYGVVAAVLTVASFLLILMGATCLTRIFITTRSLINDNYKMFGITAHLGTAFLVLLWFSFIASFFTMALWAGPIAFKAPEGDFYDSDYSSESEKEDREGSEEEECVVDRNEALSFAGSEIPDWRPPKGQNRPSGISLYREETPRRWTTSGADFDDGDHSFSSIDLTDNALEYTGGSLQSMSSNRPILGEDSK